jgi:secreted trypsin-like serine protease
MLFTIVSSVFALPSHDDKDDFRIVGGVEVSPKFRYPFMVTLFDFGSLFCGGILVNPTTVITAAHCSQRKPSKDLEVFGHRHNLASDVQSENGLVFSVDKIIPHPQYSSNNFANDVAIWKVTLKSGSLSVLGKYQVNLDNGAASKPGALLYIAGWGTTSSGGDISDVLLETVVPVSTPENCKRAYPNVHPTSICAGFQEGGKDTCQGDSGGPMFTQNGNGVITLVGITSYGNGCALKDFPGVYTRVSAESVTSFIKANL